MDPAQEAELARILEQRKRRGQPKGDEEQGQQMQKSNSCTIASPSTSHNVTLSDIERAKRKADKEAAAAAKTAAAASCKTDSAAAQKGETVFRLPSRTSGGGHWAAVRQAVSHNDSKLSRMTIHSRNSNEPVSANDKAEDDALRGTGLRRSNSDIVRPVSGSRLLVPFQKAGFSWPDVFTTLVRRKVISRKALGRGDGSEEEGSTSAAAEDGSNAAAECESVYEVVEEKFKDAPWHRRILRIILSWEFEIFLLFLLACDVIFLIVELELVTKKLCHISWEDGAGVINTGTALGSVNCTEAPRLNETFTCEHTRTFRLPVAYAHCPFHVEEELPHHIHVAEAGIAWASRSIIIFFALELLLLLISAGPRIFIKHKLYLLDAVIIIVSLVLDILAATIHIQHISELVIVARIWRFGRIIHGVGISVHDVDEHEHNPGEGEHLLHEIDPSTAQPTPAAKDGAQEPPNGAGRKSPRDVLMEQKKHELDQFGEQHAAAAAASVPAPSAAVSTVSNVDSQGSRVE